MRTFIGILLFAVIVAVLFLSILVLWAVAVNESEMYGPDAKRKEEE